MAIRCESRQCRIVARRVPGILFAILFIGNCSVVPRDSAGTLDRVRDGELRVGVAHHPPWVRLESDQAIGLEPELIVTWAQSLGARVTWRPGAEAELVEALHRRELDVMAAGLQSDSPYRKQIALTRAYIAVNDQYGSTKRHVLAVMPGESALLLSLDRFLASADADALRRRVEEYRRP